MEGQFAPPLRAGPKLMEVLPKNSVDQVHVQTVQRLPLVVQVVAVDKSFYRPVLVEHVQATLLRTMALWEPEVARQLLALQQLAPLQLPETLLY